MLSAHRSLLRALLVPLIAVTAAAPSQAQCRSDYIPGQGFRGVSLAVTEFLNWDPDADGPAAPVIVAGGGWGFVGNLATIGVAAWDGESWSAIGDGLDSSVSALTLYEGDVIAGGYAVAPGSSINRWNGSTWTPMPGLGIYIEDLIVYHDELYAAGSFQIAFGSAADYLA